MRQANEGNTACRNSENKIASSSDGRWSS